MQAQDGQIAVARAVAHDVRDAAALAERGTHPHDVVVAPLKIHIVKVHQEIHDLVRVRTSVKNIADDM